MASRLTSSRFVGRRGELAQLVQAVADAAAGRPGVILLGGESGVGKTRLTGELEQNLATPAPGPGQASSPAPRLLRGECLEQGDGELPYAPLIGALRPLVRGGDPVLEELSPGSRTRLTQLLPSLDPAGLGRVDPGAEANLSGGGQLQLFEALLELLDRLAARQPLVLLIEDAHWADRSTRSFIAFLCRALREEHILVLLTYRTDELHRRHPLRPLLSELDRSEYARRIELAPFDRAELAEALTDILGRPPEAKLLNRLLDRTEGNPLFVEELLAAGLDGRGAPPQSLNDAFMLRIERLSAAAQQLAGAVAVAVRVDEPTLIQATGLSELELREAMREAVGEHVLETVEDGRLQFRHALLREALYDDLLPGERGQLHLRLAQALDAAQPPECDEDDVERIARIAAHYAAAGDQPAALRAAVNAAAKARQLQAFGDAAELLDRALALWPRVEDAETVAGIDLVELLTRAAFAHGLDGDFNTNEQLLTQALDLLDPEQDPIRVGRLLAKLCRNQWRANRGAAGLATAERALELLPPGHRARIALQSWLARTRVLRGQYREALQDGAEALASAREQDMPVTTGEILNTLGMAHAARGEIDQGVALLEEAMDLARQAGDLDDLATAYANLAERLYMAGRLSAAREVIDRGLEEVPTTVRRSYRWMRLTRLHIALESGDWAAVRAERLGPPDAYFGTAQIYRLLCEAEMLLHQGDDDAACARLDEALPLVSVTAEAQWHSWHGSLLAEWCRRHGELEEARSAVSRALDELEVCTDDVMGIAIMSASGLRVEADIVLRARDLRDSDAERDGLLRAQFHLDRLEAAAEDGGPLEAAWLATGRADMARARADEDAAERWAVSADAFTALEQHLKASLWRWRQAEALVAVDQREAATEVAAAALAEAREMGAGWLENELEALCARARLRAVQTAPGLAGPGADDAREELPFGLTEREGQVLALLAQGATNRQIGASLYMAEKTASVHVSRILAKLGVGSRTQAAAVAHRMHLAGVGAMPERV